VLAGVSAKRTAFTQRRNESDLLWESEVARTNPHFSVCSKEEADTAGSSQYCGANYGTNFLSCSGRDKQSGGLSVWQIVTQAGAERLSKWSRVEHLTIQETAKLYSVATRWGGTPSENALER
jgi:hypothetical protein